jgi:hypothetical protein
LVVQAFELDDGTDDATALKAYKQSLEIALAQAKLNEAENEHLRGDNHSLNLEVRVLRAVLADTGEYRRYFGRPRVIHTVDDSGFTVPTE